VSMLMSTNQSKRKQAEHDATALLVRGKTPPNRVQGKETAPLDVCLMSFTLFSSHNSH
jgi:hypothetical protein